MHCRIAWLSLNFVCMSDLQHRHYFLRCPRSCAIPIPRPIRAGMDGSFEQINADNRSGIFVCPYCGLASVHCGRDIQELLLPTPDLFKSGMDGHSLAVLVSTEVECVDQKCGTLTDIFTVLGSGSGEWKPQVIADEWTFPDNLLCERGHQLCFDESRRLHAAGRVDDPF
jgi:hypothetical protein